MAKKIKADRLEKMAKGIERQKFFSDDGNTLAKYFGANHTHMTDKEKRQSRRQLKKDLRNEDI